MNPNNPLREIWELTAVIFHRNSFFVKTAAILLKLSICDYTGYKDNGSLWLVIKSAGPIDDVEFEKVDLNLYFLWTFFGERN